MKILSYNVYGVKDTNLVPKWEIRQKNLVRIINSLLCDNDIKICCFQEVNKYNIDLLNVVLNNNGFKMLDGFPMKTKLYPQYNIIAIRNEDKIKFNFIYCLPHGEDNKYKTVDKQSIDYGMSNYRTTVFVFLDYDGKKYLIGNIHADNNSTIGKTKGIFKSLDYMDYFDIEYKILIGDMNMVSHMSEVKNILNKKKNYIALSRSKNFNILDNSWHAYGIKEQVNIDFAFIEKDKKYNYDYKIIKQDNILYEASDHRPIIITIN